MHIVSSVEKKQEKVVLAGLVTPSSDRKLFDIDMQEMYLLCTTADAEVCAVVAQKRAAPDAATFLGRGKLEEIAVLLRQSGATTLVIDAGLSPGQIRSIEKIVSAKVIDRSQLILDIFAKHAHSNEAQIQVELAQLRTLYPRLTRAWTHFSQQVGGIGTRGPGEKQLEVDRRLVQKRINDLKNRLEKIEKSRCNQRKGRSNMYKIALVGYTNVGKSTLLNALCGSKERVENKLFATLDTATRRLFISGAGTVVVSDTVGFIRKLPHHLIASFRSTLAVVREANLILMVIDASCPWVHVQLETVEAVLKDLDADAIPRMVVINKADLVTDPFIRKKHLLAFPGAIMISSFDSVDIQRLKSAIGSRITAMISTEENWRDEQMCCLDAAERLTH